MNYLLQIKGFWIAQNAYSLGVEEVGLYFHLLEISNTLRWMNPFKRNNSKIMSDLGIKDRRTLDRYRNRLKQAGTIDFETKYGDANVTYWVIDLSIFCTGFGIGDGIGDGIGYSPGDGIDNKNKTKLKPNKASETIVSGLSKGSSLKKKKSEKKKEDAALHWNVMVGAWFKFYRDGPGGGVDPTFEGQAPAALKKICERLQKRSESKQIPWDEAIAGDTLGKFLTYAYELTWLKDNFLLPNLERQFDKIVNQHGSGNTKSGKADYSDLKAEIARDLGISAH